MTSKWVTCRLRYRNYETAEIVPLLTLDCQPHSKHSRMSNQEVAYSRMLRNPLTSLSPFPFKACSERIIAFYFLALTTFSDENILGDPGADSGGEGKSKRAEKYGTKKSKERREEPLGTMSYQTSSKRSPPFCLVIEQKNTKVFFAPSAHPLLHKVNWWLLYGFIIIFSYTR